MDIINTITDKYDWESKINDPKIIAKWKKELYYGYDISSNVVDTIIRYLRKSEYTKRKDKKTMPDDDDDHHGYGVDIEYSRWKHTRIYLDYSSDLKLKCICKCRVCSGKEYNRYGDDEEDEDEDEIEYDNICKCEDIIKIKTNEFLDEYVIQKDSLITSEIKHDYINNVNKFRDSIAVDYHPGSSSVIDLVHPSLYPYINGVSNISGVSEELLKKFGIKADTESKSGILFQWLPSEFSVDSDGVVSIDSYINNLPKGIYPELYKSIEQIFSKFVPLFQDVMNKMITGRFISNIKRTLDKCQVIVKIAETVLTPENPVFKEDESHWHLEGLPEEHIIATGIYYYDFENITKSSLSFRVNVDGDSVDYAQDCSEMFERHSGLSGYDRDFDEILEIGSIETTNDLSIVFPNFMQHKVSKFSLKDKTKIGSRKILVFFLIDPANPIISTAYINPQQYTIPLKDAKIYRELLMFNRKYEIKHQNELFSKRVCSLCEH